MSGTIFLVRDDHTVESLAERTYESEASLQELLATYPDLLAGEQMIDGSPRRWLLVSKEASVSVSEESANCFADHLFLDQEGIPTIVEVKRSADTRIRREVVGQMLDYAASLAASWPVSRMQSHLEKEAESSERLLRLLKGNEPHQYWECVDSNLEAGKIRMVFVADEIPPELRKIVDFLAKQLRHAQVFAVEVRNFQGGRERVLVPRLVSSPLPMPAASGGRQWDERSFFAEIKSKKPLQADVAQRIFEWARKNLTDFWYGKGETIGSCFPRLWVGGSKLFLFAMWTSGVIEMQFQHMRVPPFEEGGLRLELTQRLNRIGRISIPEDAINRRPSFDMALIASDEDLGGFLDTMAWAVEQMRIHAAR